MSTSTNIHWAESITFERIQFKDFWTHRITVIATDGTKHEIDAFAHVPLELGQNGDRMAHQLVRTQQADEVPA